MKKTPDCCLGYMNAPNAFPKIHYFLMYMILIGKIFTKSQNMVNASMQAIVGFVVI